MIRAEPKFEPHLDLAVRLLHLAPASLARTASKIAGKEGGLLLATSVPTSAAVRHYKRPGLVQIFPVNFSLGSHFALLKFGYPNMTTSSTSSKAYSYDVDTSRPSSSTTTNSTNTNSFGPNWPGQVLPTPYISRRRLLQILRNRFGENGFRVQVYASRSITRLQWLTHNSCA